MENGTTILFGLPGVAVQRVERVREDGTLVRLVHVVTTASSAGCPQCGVVSTSVKQRRTTRPRDLPYGEEPLAVRWRKRQYRCRELACPRKAFTESIDEVPPRARLTGRLCRQLASQVASGRSVSAVAAQFRVSWPVAHRRYAIFADGLLTEPEPPVVLGIDETRRGKPKWIQDTETGRWVRTERFETNFTDLSGQGRLLGQVAGRTGTAVAGWLDARGQDWKNQVAYVAIDPCAVYRSAITRTLPHAVIVVDHFHLVRLANQAVTRVRQRVTRQVLGRRGTTRDPAWANRRRLLRARERLTQQQFTKMWDEILAREATGELLAAWIAKEELRYLLALARTHAPRSEISSRLFAFYDWCARADVPEVTTLAKTIEAWWPQILAFIDTGITNAGTEANNRLIKDAARIAFGFRNLDNQRRRVRSHCKRTMIS